MQQASARLQNKLNFAPGRAFVIALLACIILFASFFPTSSVSAQAETPNEAAAESLDPENLLIFKTFGDPAAQTQPLPAPCSGDACGSGTTAYDKPFTAFIPSDDALPPAENPSLWPNAATVKLLSHWPSGATTTCTGTLVDAKYVLTAAHCIYSHQTENCAQGDSACWVDDLEALPAYQGGEAPAGRSGYESILTWTDWTELASPASDLAAIKLRYPLGAEVGWLGIGFNADDAFFTGNAFALSGYPESAPYNGEDMAFSSGTVTGVSDDLLYLAEDLDAGWEGAALAADNGVAYAVLSAALSGSGAILTRLTYSKFEALRTFIQEGQPKEDGGNLTLFTVEAGPEWSFPGQALTPLTFILWNYSSSPLPAGRYPVDIYLSADNRITTGDAYLGAYTFEGALEANQGLRISPTQRFWLPEEIHGTEVLGGTFYLGAIVDFADGNPEDNCSDYYQPQPLWVFDSDNSNYVFPIWYK